MDCSSPVSNKASTGKFLYFFTFTCAAFVLSFIHSEFHSVIIRSEEEKKYEHEHDRMSTEDSGSGFPYVAGDHPSKSKLLHSFLFSFFHACIHFIHREKK